MPMPEMPAEVSAAIIAVGGALLGTWFGGWLNRKQAHDTAKTMMSLERERYARERLWDAKRVSYTEIIALSQVFLRTADLIITEREDNEIEITDFYTNDYFIQLKDENIDGYKKLIIACDNSRLIQSESFAERVAELKLSVGAFDMMEAVQEFDSDVDYLHARSLRYAALAKLTHNALLAIALAEMKSA